MTPEEFKNLKVGDVIRYVNDSSSVLVAESYGDHVVVVKVQIIGNPSEWLLVRKAGE